MDILDDGQIIPQDFEGDLILRYYATRLEAIECQKLLLDHDIPSALSLNAGDLDYVLAGETEFHKFGVKIRYEDKERAETTLLNWASQLLDSIDANHYLFSFTDEELLEVLIKRDEWSEFDYLLSTKILNDRGVRIDNEQIESKRNMHRDELKKAESGQGVWIAFGYISAFLGGFLGLVLGSFLWRARKRLPDGTMVPAYDTTTRTHGKIIFIISLIVFPLALLLVFISSSLNAN